MVFSNLRNFLLPAVSPRCWHASAGGRSGGRPPFKFRQRLKAVSAMQHCNGHLIQNRANLLLQNIPKYLLIQSEVPVN